MHNYHATWTSSRRATSRAPCNGTPDGLELGPGWGWGTMVLPHLEQQPLFKAVNFSLPITDPASQTVRSAILSVVPLPEFRGDRADELSPVASPPGPIPPSTTSRRASTSARPASSRSRTRPANNNGVFYRNSRIGHARHHRRARARP